MYSGNRIYITLNRPSQWRRCLLQGLEISGNSLVPSEAGGVCTIITYSIDSTEHDFRWQELTIDAEMCDNAIIKVSAYAANSALVSLDGSSGPLDVFLTDDTVSCDKRLAVTLPLFRPIFRGCLDGPVGLCGRYIWIKLEFFMLDKRELRVNKLKLLLHSERMINYLPEAYLAEDGGNGFLSRYLSIFDSIFFEMDGRIEAMADQLDYRVSNGGMLRYLAEWLCIEDTAYLSEERLREMIGNAAEDNSGLGVKSRLISWIEREYGVTPNIIEYYSVDKLVHEGGDREVYRRLFGEDPYRFFVLLPEKTFANTREAATFMRRLKSRIPAYTEAEVVVTRLGCILEKHTYLGVNSVLRGYSPAAADEEMRIFNDIFLGRTADEQ